MDTLDLVDIRPTTPFYKALDKTPLKGIQDKHEKIVTEIFTILYSKNFLNPKTTIKELLESFKFKSNDKTGACLKEILGLFHTSITENVADDDSFDIKFPETVTNKTKERILSSIVADIKQDLENILDEFIKVNKKIDIIIKANQNTSLSKQAFVKVTNPTGTDAPPTSESSLAPIKAEYLSVLEKYNNIYADYSEYLKELNEYIGGDTGKDTRDPSKKLIVSCHNNISIENFNNEINSFKLRILDLKTVRDDFEKTHSIVEKEMEKFTKQYNSFLETLAKYVDTTALGYQLILLNTPRTQILNLKKRENQTIVNADDIFKKMSDQIAEDSKMILYLLGVKSGILEVDHNAVCEVVNHQYQDSLKPYYQVVFEWTPLSNLKTDENDCNLIKNIKSINSTIVTIKGAFSTINSKYMDASAQCTDITDQVIAIDRDYYNRVTNKELIDISTEVSSIKDKIDTRALIPIKDVSAESTKTISSAYDIAVDRFTRNITKFNTKTDTIFQIKKYRYKDIRNPQEVLDELNQTIECFRTSIPDYIAYKNSGFSNTWTANLSFYTDKLLTRTYENTTVATKSSAAAQGTTDN